MRGELDDTLARMARREELQRRRAAAGRSSVDEVVEAVQRVVARHPGLVVTMSVAEGSTASVVRVEWAPGGIAVAPATAPAVEPTIAPAVEPSTATAGEPSTASGVAADPAARLAELIRRDPSLLDGETPG